MRLPGYCDVCHRFRQVTVAGHGMAMLAATRVAHGVCQECEDKQEAARKERRR